MNIRKRRRRKPYKNTNIKYRALSVFMVICVSVAAGYMTAAYILGPALGLEIQPSFFETIKKSGSEKEEDKETEKTIIEDKAAAEEESGFAMQYGSFSAKEGAEELAAELKASGIQAEIVEKDGMYKVISQLFDTKEEARTYMEKSSQDTDVFITEIP